jgi:hypothetical protein
MLGKEAEVKLSQIPLSNDTISDRIEDMSKDILAQVVADLISSPAKFSLQLDETTDVSNLSQLVVFVRYVKDGVIKYFLFCKPLTTTTKVADVKKLVDDFFKDKSFVGYGFCSLFGQSSSHAGKKVWFWCASESRCTTHHCYALYSKQACVGNKNLASKTGRRIKNCSGMRELCAN